MMCENCGQKTSPHSSVCGWNCLVEYTKKHGGVVHTPNNLPIKCIAGDRMLEHEHGDHPDYKFPVEILFRPSPSQPPRRANPPEEHALIYSDGCIAVTLYECEYYMWHLEKNAEINPAPSRLGKWLLSPDALNKVLALAGGRKSW